MSTRPSSHSPKARNRVTIDEVALHCDLSVATVSNALSGRGRMRAETRARVVSVAQTLGYRASPAARGLRMRRSWVMGLIIPDIANPMFGEIARGAADVLEAAGCQLLAASHDAQPDKQARLVRSFMDQGLDGVILQPWSSNDAEVSQLVSAGVPVVLLARRHTTQPTDYVSIDNASAMQQALAHLASLGHRNIAITLLGGRPSSSSEERLCAYAAFQRERAQPWDERWVLRVARTDLQAGLDLTDALLALQATAVVASNDMVALGIRQGIISRGLQVPRDMSIVAIDATYLSALPGIELTSLDLPKRLIGEIAARMVLERFQDHHKPFEDRVLKTELVPRGSSARPRSG